MLGAQVALDNAEAIDGYRAACSKCAMNAAARSQCNYTPSFLEKDDVKRLNGLINGIPLLHSMDVVVLDSSADNGYPHTRANSLVCMPKSFLQSSSDNVLKETLRHEAIHIHQRRHKELWSSACSRDGWSPVSTDKLPSEFVERCRLNPDTFGSQRFWAWDAHNVPMPLFVREDYPTLGGIQIKWLDLRNMTLFSDPPSSFVKRYGDSPSQPEHPFELLAVEFAAEKLQTDDSLRTKLKSL